LAKNPRRNKAAESEEETCQETLSDKDSIAGHMEFSVSGIATDTACGAKNQLVQLTEPRL
jgi:hypothetical protein